MYIFVNLRYLYHHMCAELNSEYCDINISISQKNAYKRFFHDSKDISLFHIFFFIYMHAYFIHTRNIMSIQFERKNAAIK